MLSPMGLACRDPETAHFTPERVQPVCAGHTRPSRENRPSHAGVLLVGCARVTGRVTPTGEADLTGPEDALWDSSEQRPWKPHRPKSDRTGGTDSPAVGSGRGLVTSETTSVGSDAPAP